MMYVMQTQNLILVDNTLLPPLTIKVVSCAAYVSKMKDQVLGIFMEFQVKEEIDLLHEQAQKREVKLQQKLDSQTVEYKHHLQDKEAKAATTLQVVHDESITRLQELEEGYQRVY